jgi:hypothetical protein
MLFDRPMGSMYGDEYPLPKAEDVLCVHHVDAAAARL